jgi:cobalt-zinc-cadmium efflux system membrane fusion protein
MTPRNVVYGILITLIAAGCKQSKPATSDEKQSDSAAAMPGMDAGTGVVESAGRPALPPSIELTAAQIQHGGVTWAAVSMGTVAGAATIPGEITPNEDRTVRLGAPTRGRIVNVAVRPGDRVSAGQLLVTMQSPEAGAAQSDVAKADAEVTARRAEAQYSASARARAERLLALKAIPRQEYDRAIADDERARASLAQAEAEARRARETAKQLSAGENANGEVVVRAPADGVVLTRSAVPGTVVDAGAPLVVVTDPANLWVTIAAPEQLAGLFRQGNRVRLVVPAFPRDTFAARVDAVGAGLEADTRTLSVRATVVSSGRLKPQMVATVIVDGGEARPAAYVPDEAVQMLEGKAHVFLARPAEGGGVRFERRAVTVGARQGGRAAILSGLAAGDVVATSGAFSVKAEFEKGAMAKMEM